MKNHNKISLLFLAILCISIIAYFFMTKERRLTNEEKQRIIERALEIKLPTSKIAQAEGQRISDKAFKKVLEGNYESAIDITLKGLEIYSHDFTLQADLAALLGDTSEITPSPLKELMLEKAKILFEQLMQEVEHQPQEVMYSLKREYYFRFGLYKEQYELGQTIVDGYWGTDQWKPNGIKGYYCQGVGASRYAKKLIEQGDKKQAITYAQKAIVAWAQYFSYKNDYYNAYVHYALALGILGYQQEMMRALERSASFINRDMNYFEFKEIIDFVESFLARKSNH